MSSQRTPSDHIERLLAMANHKGETWNFQGIDREALFYAANQLQKRFSASVPSSEETKEKG